MDRPPRDKNESIAHFKMTRTISYGCDVSVSLVADNVDAAQGLCCEAVKSTSSQCLSLLR